MGTMTHRVCPWWLGYCLICPLQILAPYVHDGMTVLEPGSGMGFFTLELARLVVASGRVIAVDIQPKMLERLSTLTAKARYPSSLISNAHWGPWASLVTGRHSIGSMKQACLFGRTIKRLLRGGMI